MMWPTHCRGKKYEYTVLTADQYPNNKCIPPGAGNSIYIAAPNAFPGFESTLQVDVDQLIKGLHGCGTDEEIIVRVLCNRSAAQLEVIKKMFLKQTGVTLEQAIDDDMGGDMQDGCLMLVRGQAALDAQILKDALSGIGTDEERLNEILTQRNAEQMEEVKKQYVLLGGNAISNAETLWDAVCGDTSFKYERFLKSRLERAGFLAFLLYETMHANKYDPTGLTGIGTNEKMLVRILTSVNRDNSGVRQVLASYDDQFDMGWKDDLDYYAQLPDVTDIKNGKDPQFAMSLSIIFLACFSLSADSCQPAGAFSVLQAGGSGFRRQRR